jgi:hypothetical protein
VVAIRARMSMIRRRRVAQRAVLELGDDLLHDGVVAVTFVGLHH